MASMTFCDPFGEAAFPTVEIPDSVVEVLEDANFNVISVSTQRGEYYVEIENYTDAGGDMIHTLYVPKGDVTRLNAWYKAFDDMYNDFDAFEEAVKWCNESGKPQRTPFSRGSDLYEDIHGYELDILATTDDALHKLAFARG